MRSNPLRAAAAPLAVLALTLMAGCAAPTAQDTRPGAMPTTHTTRTTQEAAPQATACPAQVPQATRCLAGQDSAGAHYLIAMPADWNGTLVLHAHGGPSLGAPTKARTVEDLERWAIVPKAGYAWAGSSFRQGGVAVRAAAEDTERLRRIFVQHVAAPKATLLHGQSWGAGVAAVGASMFTADEAGRRPYDGVLLSSGMLAGGSRGYDFRLDLRVIYQALCGNHPRADEPSYPLWMGLPADSKLTPAGLRERVNACLALDRKPAERTPEQQRKVHTIVRTLQIPESSIASHLAWGTFHFREIAQVRTQGRNVFGNIGAQYRGSDDDAALNAAVARYAVDPAAVAQFAADTDPDGRIPVPVLTVHGIGDPTAFVEVEDSFRRTMARAGTDGHLVQTFTSHNTHSYLADPVYVSLLEALGQWAAGGARPTPAGIAARCTALEAAAGSRCGFQPDYVPAPLSRRITPRQ